MSTGHGEVIAPASVGAFLTCAPWLAAAAGAGPAYGVCGAAAAAAGVGAVPFALKTREMPTAVALAGVGAAGWGSWTAWVCWSDTSALSGLAIGTFFTLASAAAGAVVRWRREGTPVERAKLDIERARLDTVEARRDKVDGSADAEESTRWAELPETVWEEPARVPDTRDPIDVGNGIVLPLVGGHIIIGGTTGAGKSVFVADMIADLLPREHLRITVIDPKGDPLLGMLRNSDVIMGELEDANRLMSGHRATMKRRGDMVRKAADAYTRGVGPLPTAGWVPTEEEPWDVIIVDEFTDLAGTDAMDDLVEIARKSRSLGQTLILDTQSLDAGLFKSENSTSGGGPRSQFATRVAGRLDNESEADKVFGTKQGKEWPAHRMPGKGHVLVRSEDQREPVMRRAPYMDMATLATWAQKCSGRAPAAVDPGAGSAAATTPVGRHLALVESAPANQGEMVMAFLDDTGSSSVASISKGTGIAQGSLRKVLQRLAGDGCVIKVDSLWRAL